MTRVLLLGAVLLLSVLYPLKASGELCRGVIRLHVIGASDSAEDQTLKLLVRDGVLKEAERLTEGCGERDEAEGRLREGMAELTLAAERVLREKGREDTARVSLTEEYYPLRAYDGMALPAGRYLSMRVVIGEGEGRTWWCILYPPLCLGSSAEYSEKLTDAGISRDTAAMIVEEETERVKVRFWIVDKLMALFGK